MTDENVWQQLTRDKPGHSDWYVERFRSLAAAGDDIVGEARLVDTMVPRGAHILDAGCGPGRVGGHLHSLGHDVVGVDLDPILIAAAEADHPGPRWLVDDLSTLDLPARGLPEPFDAIVCAGNVMTFLAPSTRAEVLRRFHLHLAEGGRIAVGFGAGRGYEVGEFLGHVEEAGLTPDVLLSTWDLRAHHDAAGFLVALLRSDGAAPTGPLTAGDA